MAHMTANREIALLLRNHNFSVKQEQEKLLVALKNEIVIRSLWDHRTHQNGCTSMLNIKIDLPNGQSIIESFGDIGEQIEEAKSRNIQNFARNSLHVITACLNEEKDNEQITYEEWEIDGVLWEVFLGNFGMKSAADRAIGIPGNLFEEIEKSIRKSIDQEKDYCWARFFFAQFDSEIAEIEFLINNQNNEEVRTNLSKLSWEMTEEFYSIRNVLMLRKKAR